MGLFDGLFGGGSQTQPQPTQTTTRVLSPEQQKILKLAMPGIESFAEGGPPERYPGTTIAGFDPSQTQGQEMALQAALGNISSLANTGAGANQFLLGDIWNPSSNPYLQRAIDAAVRPITENYQQVVRPAVRDAFVGAGQQFGGSRRGLAEGQAANAYLRNVGDTSSTLVQKQYETNMNAMLRALGLLPQTQQAALTPSLVTSGVGDVRQALAQAQLGENVGNWNYDQLAPFLQSKELISLLSGIPGGSNQSTANLPARNPVSSALGGAATGASLGSAFGPWGALAGGGIGALLSFL